jgi:quaternary ammonium compound-resistance protein SugE
MLMFCPIWWRLRPRPHRDAVEVRDGPAFSRGRQVAWTYLIIAGLLEVVWALLMKQSAGFTRLWPSIATILFMIGSFVLLSFSMRSLPLGTAYVVWTGIGAVGAFLVGATLLHEPVSPLRAVAAGLIVTGLVLMKLTSAD